MLRRITDVWPNLLGSQRADDEEESEPLLTGEEGRPEEG